MDDELKNQETHQPADKKEEKLTPEEAFIKQKKEKPWDKFKQRGGPNRAYGNGPNKARTFLRKSGMGG